MNQGSSLRRGGAVIGRALRSAPRQFAWAGVGAALYALMTIAASEVLGQVTDRVILPAFDAGRVEVAALAVAGAAVLGVAALKAVGVVGRRWGAYLAQYGLQATFRRKVTRQYLRLPLAWHRRHTTGQLLSNANADVEAAFFVAAPLPMAFAAALMLVLTGVLLVISDLYLAAVGFAVGPAIGLANLLYQRRMRHAATVAQEARADVSEIAHESFDAALVVKTLGREGAETARFGSESGDLRDKMIEVGRLRAYFDPVIEALPNLGILAVLLVGAWRVEVGALSAGDLVQFAYLFQLVALPMRVFGWLLGELPRGIVGWERLDHVLGSTGEMRYGTATGAGDRGAQADLHDVSYRYPATARDDLSGMAAAGAGRPGPAGSAATVAGARTPDTHGAGARGTDVADGRDGDAETRDDSRGVQAVSFDADAGKTIAIVGPTGGGKSTVAALMVRLYDPDAGRIDLDGGDLRDLSRGGLANHVAIVFQEAFLFDDTVRGNITLGGDFTHEQVEEAACVAQAHGFVTALERGYDTVVGERGSMLSGGQRQRIALARALIRRPRLLVLDDATSAVDPAVEAAILRGLADSALPTTVLVVAYRRGSIALADEVVFVADGTVVARGPHAELAATVPGYARLVSAYDERQGAPVDDRSSQVPA